MLTVALTSARGRALRTEGGRKRFARIGGATVHAVPVAVTLLSDNASVHPQEQAAPSRMEEFTTSNREAEKLKKMWAEEKQKEVRAYVCV